MLNCQKVQILTFFRHLKYWSDASLTNEINACSLYLRSVKQTNTTSCIPKLWFFRVQTLWVRCCKMWKNFRFWNVKKNLCLNSSRKHIKKFLHFKISYTSKCKIHNVNVQQQGQHCEIFLKIYRNRYCNYSAIMQTLEKSESWYGILFSSSCGLEAFELLALSFFSIKNCYFDEKKSNPLDGYNTTYLVSSTTTLGRYTW